MQNNTFFWLGVGILVALLLVGSIFLLKPRTVAAPGITATSSTTGSTTTIDLGGGVTAQVPAGTTIHEVPSITLPSLDRNTIFSASLSESQIASLKADEAAAITSLKANPQQADQWLRLGLDYKEAGDYTGAIGVWTYLTQAAPMSYIAFADLADLYQNFDINYPKAEVNYLAAIKLNPTDADYYANLYNIYRYHENNTAAANAIVARGLKVDPSNGELLSIQQQESTQ